MFKLTKVIR